MNLSDFLLLKEDTDSYSIGHPQGKSIRVPKKGLSDKAHVLISKLKKEQGLDEGGEVKTLGEMIGYPGSQKKPKPKGYADGGDVARGDPSWLRDMQKSGDQAASQARDEYIPEIPQEAPAPVQGIPASAEIGQAPAAVPAAQPEVPGIPNQAAALSKEAQSVAGGVAAESAEGAANAKVYEGLDKQMAANAKTQAQHYTDFKVKDDELMNAMKQGKIDPDRYLHSMGTGSKVASAIGMILGGIGSGLTGGPNLAAKQLDDAINRDMEAQKDDQSKKANLWKMNRDAYHSDLEANLATQNQMLNGAKFKVMANAERIKGPLAQQRAAQLTSDIEQKMEANRNILAVMRTTSTGGMSESDPATLVPFLVKDPTQQAQVYKEIAAAQNTNRMGEAIKDSFEQAVKENTAMKTGAGLFRTPGSVYALHQAMQPTFADLEGTVRQAAMDNTFKNITPAPGDSDHTVETKRNALHDYLQSKSSAPVAKGNHIDLSRFSSTAQSPHAPKIQRMGGANYQKVPGGWKKVE